MARHELSVMRCLSHINVIVPHVLELDHWTSESWLYMEYGGSALVDVVLAGTLSDDCVHSWCTQILAAVQYLHVRSIAHMDLKLDNMTVTTRGVIKIIDLGLAHVYRDGEPDVSTTTLRGSESYAAPEILLKRAFSPYAADVWSLGVCLFGLCAGRFPFSTAHDSDPRFAALAAWQGHDACTTSIRRLVEHFRERGGSIPGRVDDWCETIERMLRVEPTERVRLQD